MARVEHDLSDAQWTALRAAWGGCAYCGAIDRPVQRDCVLAVSRGGRYTLGNVAPACASCNASKWHDEVTGWLRRKRLDERAFLLRHAEISAALTARFAGSVADQQGDRQPRQHPVDGGALGVGDHPLAGEQVAPRPGGQLQRGVAPAAGRGQPDG
jgi:hypothetical protein